jgi:hypothetical protein
MMKAWKILLKKTPNKMGKKGTNPIQKKKQKLQSGSLNGKGTNHAPKPPLVARSISKRKKLDEKLERVVNLEKPSPKMTTHFKIKVT